MAERPRVNNNHIESKSRRRFLILATLGTFGLLYGGVDSQRQRLLYGLENLGIVDLIDLSERYSVSIKSNRPLEIDPIIVRSTLYNGMFFFGARHQTAIQNSQFIPTPINVGCGVGIPICSYDTPERTVVEISSQFPGFLPSDPASWVMHAHVLSHESYHLDINKTQQVDMEEDYGVLGKVKVVGRKRGFWQETITENSLAEKLIIATISLPDGTRHEFSLLEEFFAEHGRRRFYRKLLSAGLVNIPIARVDYSGYHLFDQSLVKLDDKSWQVFFGGAVEPARVDYLHRNSDRYGLLTGVGEAIQRRNTYGRDRYLSTPDKAALGLVALSDFAKFNATQNRVLSNLTKNRLTPDLIAEGAQELIK